MLSPFVSLDFNFPVGEEEDEPFHARPMQLTGSRLA